MCIHDNAFIDIEGIAEHDIGGLARNTAERHEFIHRSWYLAAEEGVDRTHRLVHSLRFHSPEVDGS